MEKLIYVRCDSDHLGNKKVNDYLQQGWYVKHIVPASSTSSYDYAWVVVSSDNTDTGLKS